MLFTKLCCISSFHAMLRVHQVILLYYRKRVDTRKLSTSSFDSRRCAEIAEVREDPQKVISGSETLPRTHQPFFSFTPFSSSSGGSECTYSPCHISKVILSNIVTHVLINTPSSFYSFRITYCLFSSKINYL